MPTPSRPTRHGRSPKLCGKTSTSCGSVETAGRTSARSTAFGAKSFGKVIAEIFTSVLELLIEEGYVKLEHYFLDGTKIEANAGKYTYVWAKSMKRNKDQLQKKINQLLEEIEQVNEEEEREYGDRDLEELGEESTIDADRLDKKVQELDEILKRRLGGGDRSLIRARKNEPKP